MTIINRENDFNKIQFDGTKAAPRSLPQILANPEAFESSWDRYEYGTSFEDAVARWNNANGPEARQRILDDLRARAQQRANLTKVDGDIACIVAGEAPWHGLGVHVDAAKDSKDLLEICKPLNTTYSKVPLSFNVNGESIELAGRYGVMMTTPAGKHRLLDNVAVSKGFTIHQIRQSIGFLDGVMERIDGAEYDSAGITHDGKRVWLSITLPGVVEPVSGDITRRYMLLTDAFDTSEAWEIMPSNKSLTVGMSCI